MKMIDKIIIKIMIHKKKELNVDNNENKYMIIFYNEK